jgi:hypothetical protein
MSPFIDVDSTDEENTDDSNEINEGEEDDNDDGSPLKLSWKTETTIQEGDSFESMVKKAHKHVKQAKDMRAMLCGKTHVALDWYNSIKDLPTIDADKWAEAVDTIIGNYCQNLALPYLGEHQPGET